MSRKFVGKLIRIMMTKSSSCDILKKKRTIRRGSGSRLKGSYLMDLRFWNYVIPDGSTTDTLTVYQVTMFWNYVLPDGSTTCLAGTCHVARFWNYVIPDGSTTARWDYSPTPIVLELCHSRWFYYYTFAPDSMTCVLELCHSRWFYYTSPALNGCASVLELCHSRWFYYRNPRHASRADVLELCHSRWFYYVLG